MSWSYSSSSSALTTSSPSPTTSTTTILLLLSSRSLRSKINDYYSYYFYYNSTDFYYNLLQLLLLILVYVAILLLVILTFDKLDSYLPLQHLHLSPYRYTNDTPAALLLRPRLLPVLPVSVTSSMSNLKPRYHNMVHIVIVSSEDRKRKKKTREYMWIYFVMFQSYPVSMICPNPSF